jgi:ABC-type glycerol-3-phosphate transport system substrate-binding protein
MNGLVTRNVRLSTVFVIIALILAACTAPAANTPANSPAAESSPAAASNGAATASPSPDAAGSPAAGGGDAVAITVSDGPAEDDEQANKDAYAQIVERFRQKSPNVTVNTTAGGYNPEAFAAKLAGGTVEDAFGVWFTETQRFIDQGVVADITDQLNASDCPASSFAPEALESVSADGRIYGIPVNMYGQGLAYNRALFEQAGLDPDQPPTTWEELRQYADQISERTSVPGFAFLSTENQGGWHFTTVLYSMGGDAQQEQNGEWTATFNNDQGVQVLEMLKEMRWTDQSMTEEQLLNIGKVNELFATGQVAMIIGGIPGDLERTFGGSFEDYGLAALPQDGGNATLGGGYAYMFNSDASPEELEAAIDWVCHRYFDPVEYEAGLKLAQTKGDAIGFPEVPVVTGDAQEERQTILAKYTNLPVENFQPFVEGMQTIEIRTEPPVEVQKMYAAIDPAVQAVLTDQNADPQQVLEAAAQQFQPVMQQAQASQ